jgi:NAD dependent epimerase/dehydratase family enzyme
MGHTLLLDSRRVTPKRLLDAGFEFKFTDLKSALENAIK